MRVLDLFSGIGGFSLGLERAGMKTVAFCEIDPYCRAVLKKHWPGVPIFEDVRKLTNSDVPGVDVICGGFPCQDISVAGKGAGIDGQRSGLWREYARLISEIRPKFVIVENVAALLGRGLNRVLGDLAEIGYDAEWHCIPASYVGAWHRRDRVWLVANPSDNGRRFLQRITRPICAESQLWKSIGATSSNEELEAIGCFYGKGNGLPGDAHRLRVLGNAVVPQIPEIIGRAIMKASNDL